MENSKPSVCGWDPLDSPPAASPNHPPAATVTSSPRPPTLDLTECLTPVLGVVTVGLLCKGNLGRRPAGAMVSLVVSGHRPPCPPHRGREQYLLFHKINSLLLLTLKIALKPPSFVYKKNPQKNPNSYDVITWFFLSYCPIVGCYLGIRTITVEVFI